MAEPNFDGQRAQVDVAAGRTRAAFSRPGRSLLTAPGLGWLREASWPVASVVLDGELCASTGTEGILSVFEARKSRQAPLAFVAFDLLQLDGREMMSEPWVDRRKRLEDLGATLTILNVAVVPVTDDAAHLWATWVGWGVKASSHAPIALSRHAGVTKLPADAPPRRERVIVAGDGVSCIGFERH